MPMSVIRWCALILPLLFATTAAAQGVVTGSVRHDSPIDVPEGRTAGDAARAISDRFALCIVQRHFVQVGKALAGDMAEQYKTLPKLMDPECFTGSGSAARSYGGADIELTTNPVAFRGALYKALVRRQFARHPAVFGATPAPMAVENGDALQFAGCVVRRDPATSLKLLLATAGSTQEDAAIAELQPQFGQCLVQGTRFRFSKGYLVAFLAEAYYREAQASNSTGAD